MSTTTEKGDPGAGMVALLLLAPSMIWKGFVATKLWSWFVVPQFGAKPLPIAVAIGFSVLIEFWFKRWKSDDSPFTWEYLGKAFGLTIWFPAFALLIGWIAQHWVAR